MSVISGHTRSSNSSILRKTSSISSKLNGERTPAKVRFILPHSKKIRQILQKFVSKEVSRDYENLVCLIRDSELFDEDIRSLLAEASQCISLLNQDLRLFVEAILVIKWINYSEEVIAEYQSFLVNLLSAHNYHAKFAIDKLVSNFLPGPDDPEWVDGNPSEDDCRKCVNVHFVINTLLDIIPMCRDLLMQSLILHYPYIKKSTHSHELYIHNLLWILDYRPNFRADILHLIFSKLVLLDVNAPKEDIENAENDIEMEEDGIFPLDDDIKSTKAVSDKVKHPIAHTLDVCLDKVFNYCIVESHDIETGQLNWEKTKRLYQDVLVVFDKVLLPTYNIHHVQFIMFLLCSFKTTITEAFLNYLWKKVCTPNIPFVHRHTAVVYIASLAARGSFVPLSMLKGTLQQMASWIHSYIVTQDGLECINSDIRVHGVFYGVCQALFYIIAFRYRDLVNTRKNIVFLESLNLAKMVTCRLNPLRACHPAVVQNFASVTRTYQLAYCYSIIEHNSRNVMPTIYQDEKGSIIISNNVLDSFFPFDPFILKRSGSKITPHYLHYQTRTDNSNEVDGDIVDTDDFLSYGTSPGFKYM
ncbi:hypothetical protein ILUMI_24946 [Ignelater luminosus]|uniref:RNA polymerase I-specific transcription initiation factor RRN3 n=1 Tax=Ignelater luminosus TaxID=2038154 RepID=A0A8K0C9H2_IGNLU|nr:hypothetical protein ILUMI_24946 [Ignelater luminosus]